MLNFVFKIFCKGQRPGKKTLNKVFNYKIRYCLTKSEDENLPQIHIRAKAENAGALLIKIVYNCLENSSCFNDILVTG